MEKSKKYKHDVIEEIEVSDGSNLKHEKKLLNKANIVEIINKVDGHTQIFVRTDKGIVVRIYWNGFARKIRNYVNRRNFVLDEYDFK